MFARLRQALRNYLASIPEPDEPERVPHDQIVREHFPRPSVAPADRSAFNALADLIVSHLPEELANSKAKQLRAKLKPGVDPAAALAGWIQSNARPQSRVGVVGLDWKARDEVTWQAAILINAHGVVSTWTYDSESDTEWKDWQLHNELPVDTALKSLGRALMVHGVVLHRFTVDDGAYAFAVRHEKSAEVLERCAALNIALINEN